MKTEFSAGGVIACFVKKQWFVLLLRDMNDMWTFPKGLIEKGELPEQAAKREIHEEVGITGLKLFAPLPPIQYFYKRKGTIKKTVQYFVFLTHDRIKPTVQTVEGIQDARWVPRGDALDMIGYRETNEKLLEETWKLLKRRTFKE